jgi:hypothetical protein
MSQAAPATGDRRDLRRQAGLKEACLVAHSHRAQPAIYLHRAGANDPHRAPRPAQHGAIGRRLDRTESPVNPTVIHAHRPLARPKSVSPIIILRTPTDIFPSINIPAIAVAWTYTGLNPEEMEGRLTTVFERASPPRSTI